MGLGMAVARGRRRVAGDGCGGMGRAVVGCVYVGKTRCEECGR